MDKMSTSGYKKNWDAVKSMYESEEPLTLGRYYTENIKDSLKHVMISMSRYKFVTKLMRYKKQLSVLEVGCSEGLGAAMIQQETDLAEYVGIDQDEEAISCASDYKIANAKFISGDIIVDKPAALQNTKFDYIFSLDVIEHIDSTLECKFIESQLKYLKAEDGVMIIGTPNIAMSPYASEDSRIAHVNMYNQERLYELMSRYFHNVFIFGMNDEVVSTGFEPMCCYIFAIASGTKNINELENKKAD